MKESWWKSWMLHKKLPKRLVSEWTGGYGYNFYGFYLECYWPLFWGFYFLAVPGLSCGIWDLIYLFIFLLNCFSWDFFFFLSCGMWDLFPWLDTESVVIQSLSRVQLWPHGLQHARLPCPSPSPGACSNSCPLSWWCHPIVSSSVVPFSSRPQSFPASGFSNELALRIRWPKYWSFSFSVSPSKEYSGLISFRIS